MSDPFLWFILVMYTIPSDRFGIDLVMFVALVVFMSFVGLIKLLLCRSSLFSFCVFSFPFM